MKKIALVLVLIMFTAVSCSFPKLVKVEDTPDPTATPVPVATEEVVIPTTPPIEPTQPQEIPGGWTKVLLNEMFSSDDGTWNTGVWPDNAGADAITNGEYQMNVHKTSYLIWSRTFDLGTPDVMMEVDSRLISGSSENGQGFVCRYTDANNFYYFFIGNDGWYSIDKYVNDEYTDLASDWAPTGVIDPNANHLQAICSGSTLSLSVNGTLLATVEDTSLTSGEVGLFTRSYESADVSIGYDNFTVYGNDGNVLPGTFDPTPFLGEDGLIYSEDFEDETGPWILGDFEESNVSIDYGWLSYSMKKANWASWDVTNEVYASDVRMTAYFSNDAGINDNQQGFICRYQDDDNFYLITFGSDGYLRVGLRSYGEWNFFIDEYGPEDVIDPAFNFVEATCIGNEFSLYVDGNLAAQATDPNNTIPSGDVGILVGTFDDPNVIISVDDFMVYSLD